MTGLLLVLAIMFLCMAGIAVRVLFVKNGEMRGTCASQNPLLNKEGTACGMCGRMPGEPCGEQET